MPLKKLLEVLLFIVEVFKAPWKGAPSHWFGYDCLVFFWAGFLPGALAGIAAVSAFGAGWGITAGCLPPLFVGGVIVIERLLDAQKAPPLGKRRAPTNESNW